MVMSAWLPPAPACRGIESRYANPEFDKALDAAEAIRSTSLRAQGQARGRGKNPSRTNSVMVMPIWRPVYTIVAKKRERLPRASDGISSVQQDLAELRRSIARRRTIRTAAAAFVLPGRRIGEESVMQTRRQRALQADGGVIPARGLSPTTMDGAVPCSNFSASASVADDFHHGRHFARFFLHNLRQRQVR